MNTRTTRLFMILILLLMSSSTICSQSKKDSIVTYTNFEIADNIADSYKGIYRKGKPYQGYFLQDKNDILLVDFYKKGRLKYQYSNNYLQDFSEPQSNKTSLDIKSTYKNGKIIDGEEYLFLKDGIIIKNWKQGKLNNFSLDIFAIHYFNRVYFDRIDNSIQISNLKDAVSKAKVYFKNNQLIYELYQNDVLIFKSYDIDYTSNSFPRKSQVSAFKKDDLLKAYAVYTVNDAVKIAPSENLNNIIFNALDTSKSKNIDTLFKLLLDSIDSNKELSESFDDKENPLVLAYFSTNDSGTIDNGIRWIEASNNESYYQTFKDGVIIGKEKKTLDEFQKIVANYFKNAHKKTTK